MCAIHIRSFLLTILSLGKPEILIAKKKVLNVK